MSISKTSAKKMKQIYLDEIVAVYLRDMNVITVNEEGTEMKVSTVAEGYVIDIDQDFIHLGQDDGTITRSIPHESCGLIEIQMVMGSMMDGDLPMRDEDIN